MKSVIYRHKVQYYETDKMNCVHHSNYIRWFEEARTFLMDQGGFGYAAMEALGVTLEGETYTFTAQGEGDDRTWTWEGREIDFAGLQDAVEALTASEFTEERPAEQQEISFTAYLDSETFPQVEVTLYRYDGASCLAAVDGESVCLVDRADAVDLMEAVRAVVLADYEEDEA